jgi:hypothetical protein
MILENLLEWANYCAKRAKETKGPSFVEPELTEIRRGWDRVIAEKNATLNNKDE